MSECELPTFYAYSEPVAKKRHVCCECSAPILKGEKHFHGRGKWDDAGVQSYRQHFACMEACMLIRDKFNDGDCIGFGELKDSFDELRRGWFGRKKYRDNVDWIALRHLMAVVFLRERKHKAAK